MKRIITREKHKKTVFILIVLFTSIFISAFPLSAYPSNFPTNQGWNQLTLPVQWSPFDGSVCIGAGLVGNTPSWGLGLGMVFNITGGIEFFFDLRLFPFSFPDQLFVLPLSVRAGISLEKISTAFIDAGLGVDYFAIDLGLLLSNSQEVYMMMEGLVYCRFRSAVSQQDSDEWIVSPVISMGAGFAQNVYGSAVFY